MLASISWEKTFLFNMILHGKKINFFFLFGTTPVLFSFPLPVDEMILVKNTFFWKNRFTGECDQWKYLKWKNENQMIVVDLFSEQLGVLLMSYQEWPSAPIDEGAHFNPLMLCIDFGRFAGW